MHRCSAGLGVLLMLAGAASLTAQTTEGTVRVDGGELPYRIIGQGRPCIVYGSIKTYGGTYSDRLAKDLRCVHFDGRVFLPDARRRNGVPHGITEAVADIEAVRRHLGLDRIVVMGNSVIGLVALAYAATYPQHTAFAISVAGPPSVPFGSDSVRAYRTRALSAERMATHRANTARLDSIRRAHPGRGFIPGYIANGALYWADSTFDATRLFDGVLVNDTLFRDLQTTPYEWPASGPKVSVPALVVLGRHDYVVTPNVWHQSAAPFSDLTIRVLERAGHWPHLEDAAAFDSTVLEWMRVRERRPGQQRRP